MNNQKQEIYTEETTAMSLIKSPKLFRKMFRSTEDIRQGKATPLFARRRKGGMGGKIYPKDDSSLRSPTATDAEGGFFNGNVTFPRSMNFRKTSPQVSIDEDIENSDDDRQSLPRIDASDNEFDKQAATNISLDNNNDSEAPTTPTTDKKNKKKRYRRFTKIYLRSKTSNKAKCQDDDKVYKARSGKMKDKALEINV